MLDERLALAAALYEPCLLGADIGTDHGYLPCHLLQNHICQRMILTDLSPNAIQRAKAQVQRRHLEERVTLRCADGLDALTEPCGCVSIMGMGGQTIAEILLRGQARLHGAVLVLSAHTELSAVRQAIMLIGYHITQERLCRADGRFYVFWRAEPGAVSMTASEIRHGTLLYQQPSPLLPDYIAWRLGVAQARRQGLLQAKAVDEAALAEVQQDIDFFGAWQKSGRRNSHEGTAGL